MKSDQIRKATVELDQFISLSLIPVSQKHDVRIETNTDYSKGIIQIKVKGGGKA